VKEINNGKVVLDFEYIAKYAGYFKSYIWKI